MLSALDPLTPENFIRLFLNGWIIDGTSGGLIVGRTHEEGHIIMMSPGERLGEFVVAGLVSGGEYILSAEATEQHWDRLHEINSDKSTCAKRIKVTPESRLLNTRGGVHDKLLVVHRQFVINAQATKRHFNELEELNSRYAPHRGIFLTVEEAAVLRSVRV